ncbi:hypothetical protein Tco_1260755 [Tanacetum coccineum]
MVEKSKLDEDLQGKPVYATLYCGMIGSLMYLTSSRPDLIYAVCVCSRYQEKPTKKHLNAVKWIFRYLKGTINMGLLYSKDTGMSVIVYANADHAGCQNTRRSTSGSAQFLGDILVSWSSKKKKSIAISSTERNIQFLDRKARSEKHVSGNAKTSDGGRGRVKVVTRGVVIRETLVMSLSKKKEKMTVEKCKGNDLLFEVALTEEAQYEEVRKKSLRDFYMIPPSGSGTITKIAPSAAKIKPSVTNEGTGAKLRVPDVTEEESTESEAES